MSELFVVGPEAGPALAHALVTNPPALADGRAHYSMIVAPNGGIITLVNGNQTTYNPNQYSAVQVNSYQSYESVEIRASNPRPATAIAKVCCASVPQASTHL